MPACDTKAVAGAILKLSTLMSEIPAVARVIINPLLVDENGLVALDASVSLCARESSPDDRYSHMLIAPVPMKTASTSRPARG